MGGRKMKTCMQEKILMASLRIRGRMRLKQIRQRLAVVIDSHGVTVVSEWQIIQAQNMSVAPMIDTKRGIPAPNAWVVDSILHVH